MVSERLLVEILATGENDIKNTAIVHRASFGKLDERMKSQTTDVLVGVRRCGKTYFLYHAFRKHGGCAYVNFEDERLIGFSAGDLEKLYEAYLGMKKPRRPVMLLDEVQNVKGWEKFVSRLQKKVKFVVSGSNATLLASEFATALTGRHAPLNIHPLSFREYLGAKGSPELDSRISEHKAQLKGLLAGYLENGGFPQVALENNPALLREYFHSTIYRDIIPRFGIENSVGLERLAYYLASNPGKPFSYGKLAPVANTRHEETVKNYVGYMEKAFLFTQLYRFDFSLKKQLANLKKIYPVDTGFVKHAGRAFSPESGRLLETAVMNELKRRGLEAYYWKDARGREIDFVVCEGLKPKALVQVTERIENEDSLASTLHLFDIAAGELGAKERMLITYEDMGFSVPKKVRHYTAAEWLLGTE
jgi:predicted AAA+ superfamily ATPase